MEVILDTNIIIDIFKDKSTLKLENTIKSEVFISVVSIGELYFVAQNSNNISKHRLQIDDFLKTVSIIEINEKIAQEYRNIRAKLKKAGTPIPENDIWIATCALTKNMLLISNDKHFQNIIGLNIKKNL